VLRDHGEDVWGLGLVTVAILGALGVYFDALGPVGHGVRHGLSSVLGVGRFLVPLACGAAGVLLVVGRPQPEPARTGLGAVLALASVAGLADLAGGAPTLTASADRLGAAGGWLGALAGNPLRAGLGGFGAAVVLTAALTLALVLFTGVTLRTAVSGAAHFGAGLWEAIVGAREAEDDGLFDHEDEDEDGDGDGQSSYHDAAGYDDESYDDGSERAVATVGASPGPSGDQNGRDAVNPGEVGAAVLAPEVEPVWSAGVEPVAARGDELALDPGGAVGEWRLPPLKLLSRSKHRELDRSEVAMAGRALVSALGAHGVDTRLVGHTVGPTVTRFELELGPGVKVARVTSLARDIAYAMASPDVRILAPIPGKSAIGVEVPNRLRQLVTLGDVLVSEEARQATHPLEVALGRDIGGRPVIVNLADMPHILISGATGAGKSSCINSLLTSVLMRATPEELRLILVDPKRVELGQYNGLPHLLTQVVVDPKKAANALSWAVTEMERRYDVLAEAGMRDITGYNAAMASGDLDDGVDDDAGGGRNDDEPVGALAPHDTASPERLPFVLVVVDELNDLMMVAARDVEESVCRIAQMARAVGIHLVLATQRPSVDVITGVIKANIPSRLAFSVSSLADSRVILDQPGAERLIGKGDMLLLTASSSVPRRIQGPWVSEHEVRSVVAQWRRQRQPEYVAGIASDGSPTGGGDGYADDDDELLRDAMELVVRSQLGSTSMLQRKLRVGFSRAGRLMDLLERRGVVGPSEGSKARAVLMTVDELEQVPGR
jgi:S-DNA-T family DNA segregation ATPase FtsK/SpoIIIE